MKSKNKFFKTTTLKEALRMGPRKFVKDYLFPAMRREHGNGFAMQTWNRGFIGPVEILDAVARPIPACGRVMCIGGTMENILRLPPQSDEVLADVLGLPYVGNGPDTASTLFYNWSHNDGPWQGLSAAFYDAKTPQQKERIAEKAVMAAIKIGERIRKAGV